MATNFPDTSINNPNTGVGWANGDAFDDTANSGLIYYWYDPVWKTSLSSADADAKYVEVTGDTMTGSLALNDKITLNATDGSATFAGGDAFIGASGNIGGTAIASGTVDNTIANNYSTLVNNVISSVNENQDGSASIGVYSWNGVSAYTPVTVLKNDGSASFAGEVTFTGDTINGIYFGDPGIAASPAGGITMRRRIIDGNLEASGCQLYIYNSKETETAFAIQTAPDGATVKDTKIALNNDGSATFAGAVRKNTFDNTSVSGYGWRIDSGSDFGQLDIQATSTAVAANKAFRVFYGTTPTIQFNNDGSATFGTAASKLEIKPGKFDGTSGTNLFIAGQPTNTAAKAISVWKYAPTTGSGGAPVWEVDYNGTAAFSNAVFNLEPDNDANYVSTTDAEGNQTLVYNGPTLDVKERLTKADTALQTLKSAAATAVDFAELKAAIATALADI